MYTSVPHGEWEECFVVRRVKLGRGYHFGLSAATGDLADNHDIYALRVMDPQPMSDEEKDDLEERIKRDVEDGVESEVHHDPQYDHRGQPLDGHELPSWVSWVGTLAVLIVLVMVYLYFQKEKQQRAGKSVPI